MDALSMFLRNLRAKYKKDWYVEYSITEVDGVTEIQFQGSIENEDWVANFAPVPIKYKGAIFHGGFWATWMIVRDEVIAQIKDKTAIRVVGYSHGGGVAQVAHYDLLVSGIPNRCFVFGSPRVFFWASRKVRAVLDITSYEMRGDIVTHLPPMAMLYFPVAKRIKLGKHCLFPHHLPHYPERYIEALKE